MNLTNQSSKKVGIIVMGTSGSGKSTIAKLISEKLNCKLIEGDEFHSKSNIQKMGRGEGLTDEDREPWLKSIASEITNQFNQNPNIKIILITCSALKKKYRDFLNSCEISNLKIGYLYLKGDITLLKRRINARPDHFAKSNLLDSQFRDLEPPTNEEFFESISVNETLESSCSEGYEACLKLIKRLE